MKNDLNRQIKKYQSGDTYQETICFNYYKKTEEFENSTDLYVDDEIIEFDEDNLTEYQISEVQRFAEEIQTDIKIWQMECESNRQTENYLRYN